MKSRECVFKTEVHGQHMVHLSLISTSKMAPHFHENPWGAKFLPGKILNWMTHYSNKGERI